MASSGRSEPTEGCPSFFKVIRYPSSPHLALPVAFVRKYLEKIPKNPTLKTATGGHSWKLKLVKIGEDYCFGHGWDKLANDVQLKIREIVVFWLIDPFTFQLSFLDANGCAKDLLPNTNINNGDKSDDDDDDDDNINDVNLCFQKVISSKTHKYYVTLPTSFVKAAGLENKTSITMKDHEGKTWSVGILVERYRRAKYSLSKPWSIVRRYYQLSDGDVCHFKFDKNEGVLNLTQVVRAKTPPRRQQQQQQQQQQQHSIKIEDEWSPVEKQPPCINDAARVKVEYESGDDIEVANPKRRMTVDKPSGADPVEIEPDMERLLVCKRVVYF